MRRTLIVSAVLAALASTLTLAGAAHAATGYDARAHWRGAKTCTKTADEGITKRKLVLDNTRSDGRVQFRIVREGDRFAKRSVFLWVAKGAKRVITVSVPQRNTVSIRVRVPEMGGKLVKSAIVTARASCYVPVVDPRAALGGVACLGQDPVATVQLNNLATTDKAVTYTVATSNASGSSTRTVTVNPASSADEIVSVAKATHVDVTALGKTLLSESVSPIACS